MRYRDVYAIDTRTGERKLAVKKTRTVRSSRPTVALPLLR
jgi:hypothetical protein